MTFDRWPVLLTCALLLTGCGKKAEPVTESAPSDETAAATSDSTAVAPAPTAEDPVTAPVSFEDIDRWESGLQAELQAVQEAATQLDAAKDDNARLEALQAATEMGTIDAGAAAAEVGVDRYRFVRNTLSSAVSQLTPIEQEMDIKTMPATMVAEMQKARETGLAQYHTQIPHEVLDMLRTRAIELRALDKSVVGERLKVATKAR